MNLSQKDTERFWSHVDKSGGNNACWPWKLSGDKDGYGKFSIGASGQIRAHRVALTLATGEDLGSNHALHSCDNPPCCNPKHLRPGTCFDNNADRQARGRYIGSKGEKHGMAKLTDEIVLAIAEKYMSGKHTYESIAKIYGVTGGAVGLIVRGEHWQHVTKDLHLSPRTRGRITGYRKPVIRQLNATLLTY